MGSNEKFCLRWNDFESNISVAFREIREEKDFFDCTLSVGDRQLQAHKLILSACSPFFRSVLKKNPHQHPLLYLKDIEFSDLQAVLNFMYHGEVNVAQEELNSFLSVAENLKIKGLTQNDSRNTKTAPKHNSQTADNTPRRSTTNPGNILADPPPPKRLRPSSQMTSQSQDDDDDIQEVMTLPVVKTEPVVEQQQQPSVTTFQQSVVQTTSFSGTEGQVVEGNLTQMEAQSGYVEEDGFDYGGYEEGYEGMEGAQNFSNIEGLNVSEMVVMLDDGFSCSLCGAQFRDKSNTRRHIRTVHLDNQVNCDICGMLLKNDRCAKYHMKSIHSI